MNVTLAAGPWDNSPVNKSPFAIPLTSNTQVFYQSGLMTASNHSHGSLGADCKDLSEDPAP